MIVILDPDRLASRLSREVLKVDGHSTTECRHAAELLDGRNLAIRSHMIVIAYVEGREAAELCGTLRRAGCLQPIMVLLAGDAIGDVVSVLGSGADDVMREPVDSSELLARVRSRLR